MGVISLIEFECGWFVPCPICNKCMERADILYEKCRKCIYVYDRCNHKEKDRNLMIKRKNFSLKFSQEVLDEIKKMGERANES